MKALLIIMYLAHPGIYPQVTETYDNFDSCRRIAHRLEIRDMKARYDTANFYYAQGVDPPAKNSMLTTYMCVDQKAFMRSLELTKAMRSQMAPGEEY